MATREEGFEAALTGPPVVSLTARHRSVGPSGPPFTGRPPGPLNPPPALTKARSACSTTKEIAMTLIEQITARALELRKAKSPLASSLITLKGDLETEAKKLKPARPLTDVEVVAQIKSTLKKVDENIGVYEARGRQDAADAAKAEKALLEEFLPKQLTADEIRAFAQSQVAEGVKMGQVMGALNAAFPGRVDGKLASGIVREVLAA